MTPEPISDEELAKWQQQHDDGWTLYWEPQGRLLAEVVRLRASLTAVEPLATAAKEWHAEFVRRGDVRLAYSVTKAERAEEALLTAAESFAAAGSGVTP